jgi:hypothetical protein
VPNGIFFRFEKMSRIGWSKKLKNGTFSSLIFMEISGFSFKEYLVIEGSLKAFDYIESAPPSCYFNFEAT